MAKDLKKNERGSVLMIVPVFFVGLSLFMTSTLRKGETREFYGDSRTENKMERVQKALAAYSHRNYRIPCPADPSVDPATAAFGVERAACDTVATDMTGVLPFRTLGLTELDARDSWGNYYTYSVSPGFTRQPLVVPGVIPAAHYNGATPPQSLPMPLKTDVVDNPAPFNTNTPGVRDQIARSFVHEACRGNGTWMQSQAEWHRGQDGTVYNFITTTAADPLVGFKHSLNKNSYKAQFCCSSAVPTYTYMLTEDFAKKSPACDPADPLPTSACWSAATPPPFNWTWDNPNGAEDISFSLSGQGAGYRSPSLLGPSGGNGACTGYSTRAPGQRRMAWRTAEHGSKGGIGSASATSSYVGKVAGGTAYMNIGGTGLKNMTVKLADLEGEEPGRLFRYSTVLIDKTTGQVITNPNPPTPCPVGATVDPAQTWWPNVSNTLWHFEAPISTGGVTHGVGGFPVGVEHFLNHPDPAVRADFNARLTALGIDPENVTMKAVHIHSDFMSSLITGVELPVPNALDNDLIVQNEVGNNYIEPRENTGYAPGDEGTVSVINPLSAQAPAYTLISHGANGAGAFIAGTANRRSTANAGAREQENADGDRLYVVQRRVVASGTAANYDDIIVWDTQMSLYNVLPNATCERAQSEVN